MEDKDKKYIDDKNRSIEPIEGWFKLEAYKFKVYLGGVSRYLLNKKLKDRPYTGE